MGLNITKQLVELMDGELGVQSEYGKGTTFTAEIVQKVIDATPMGDFSDSFLRSHEQLEEFKPKLVAPGIKVLVTDDNEMNLEVFTGLLSDTRMKITCASSGKETLECLKKDRYDVIFVDQMMPGMSGTETLQAIKDDHLADGIPIIALTADAIVGARDIYLKEGFTDYLSKPVMYEELEKILFKYIDPAMILSKEQIEREENANKSVVLVINDSSERLNEIRDMLGSRYKGVFVKDEAQAEKYLSKHDVRFVIRDGGVKV